MNRFLSTLNRYVSFFRWLLQDSLWRRKEQVLIVLTTGFFGVAFQAQVFVMIIYYAQHFSSGEDISLLGFSFATRASMGLLTLGSVATVGLLLLSAFCIYFSRRNMLRMGREYEEFCSKRVLYLLSEHLIVLPPLEKGKIDSYLFRLIRSDSRFAGRILRILLSLIIPGSTLIAASGVTIYLEPFLTLLIAALSSVFGYYQIRVSTDVAGHSMRFEKLAQTAGLEFKGILQHYKQQSRKNENKDPVEDMFARSSVKKQLDSYEGRLQAVEISRLVSGIFMALILGLVLVVMGSTIIREGHGWGRLIIYIGALRFVMLNLRKCFTSITSINRFYPQVRRYFLFIQSIESSDRVQFPALREYTLECAPEVLENALKGSSTKEKVKPGQRLALVTSLDLNRYTLAILGKTLLGDDEKAFKGALYSMRFATFAQSCPGMSLRKILSLNLEVGWSDLRTWFADENDYQIAREQLPGNLDNQITDKIWDQVAPWLKFVLSLISARQTDFQWILLEADGLGFLDIEKASCYLDFFQEKVVVIVFNKNLDHVGAFHEDLVAVTREGYLMGFGAPDWFESVRTQIEGILSTEKSERGDSNGEAILIEEDDED